MAQGSDWQHLGLPAPQRNLEQHKAIGQAITVIAQTVGWGNRRKVCLIAPSPHRSKHRHIGAMLISPTLAWRLSHRYRFASGRLLMALAARVSSVATSKTRQPRTAHSGATMREPITSPALPSPETGRGQATRNTSAGLAAQTGIVHRRDHQLGFDSVSRGPSRARRRSRHVCIGAEDLKRRLGSKGATLSLAMSALRTDTGRYVPPARRGWKPVQPMAAM